MEMELNKEERQYLENALNHYLSELDGEIRGTDSQDFRDGLKHEQEILRVLADRIGTQ